jgi:hypothetical protein
MAGFMNAELVKVRDNLVCGHCECKFVGSDSQARKVKYESAVVYCSAVCRHAGQRKKFSTPIPNRGPCKHCKKEFSSRTAKMFCSLGCYNKSDQFQTMLKKAREKSYTPESRAKLRVALQKGADVPCLECGEVFYQKRKTKTTKPKKFCNKTCYRAYMAKRFDRWIANPEEIALPQCYDEFLDKQELSCVIEGCDWRGKHLTIHVNQTHGLEAKEFKRAAGFNLSTGVVARPLAEALRERAVVGVALTSHPQALELAYAALADNPIRYKSKEGKEHAQKARALAQGKPGPTRICEGCGIKFTQSTIYGTAKYCSLPCRDIDYKAIRDADSYPKKTRTRNPNGTFVWSTPHDES